MPIKPNDHSSFHDSVLRAALAGATISVLGLLLAPVAGPAAFGLHAAGFVVFVLAAIAPPRWSSAAEVALLLLLGVGAGVATRLSPNLSVALSSLLLGLGLARGRDRALRDQLVVLAIGATGSLGALVIQRALLETQLFVPWLGVGLSQLLIGAIGGAVVGVSGVGRLFDTSRSSTPADELEALSAEVGSANADVGTLLRRAAEAHRQAAEVVGRAPHAADNLVRRMVGFAREWLEIERRASITRPESLVERIAVLEQRVERTTDSVAHAELCRAIDAIRAQKEALSEILSGRERAVARLEHQVATLERLRFAALRHRSADAGRVAAELQPVLDELAEAGGDYDIESDALRDADAETSALRTN